MQCKRQSETLLTVRWGRIFAVPPESARPRAQQAPNCPARSKVPSRHYFRTLLRPGTGALRLKQATAQGSGIVWIRRFGGRRYNSGPSTPKRSMHYLCGQLRHRLRYIQVPLVRLQALLALCRSLVGALGWLYGGFGVAISWLSTGLGVALMSHEVAFFILPSAFCLPCAVACAPALPMRDFHASSACALNTR